MKMTGYSKLFGSIVTSTIWREDKETKILWITMLALKNKHGVVEGSIPGLADLARLTVSETEQALQKLRNPDPYSRTKEFEGRRIEDIDGGWLVLNHEKWRKKMSEDERRDYLKIKQREHRERVNKSVNKSKQKSTLSTHTDTEYKKQSTDTKKNTPLPPLQGDIDTYFGELGMSKLESERFHDHYASNGWRVGKNPMKDWKAAARNWKKGVDARNASNGLQLYRSEGNKFMGNFQQREAKINKLNERKAKLYRQFGDMAHENEEFISIEKQLKQL